MKKVVQLSIALFIFLYSTGIIKANQTIYQQDFSQTTELSNWQILQNQGDNRWGVCLDTAQPASWQIKNEWIGIVLDGTSCTTIISPNNAIDLSQYSNYLFEVDIRLDEATTMDRNILFAWANQNNWYDLKLFGTGLHLEKVIDGNFYSLAQSQTTFPFVKDETYHFAIFFNNLSHHILVYVNDQTMIDTIDQPPYINQSFSFGLKTALGGGRSVSFFDNLIINTFDLDDGLIINNEELKSIPVPTVKQTNIEWSNEEYDHATEWSEKNSTIKRWGCALSSMVMILQYHGINLLPNGEVINPLSLNNWLKEQPDGYIGDGLLNWLAVTRLTQKISAVFNTPKLEFSRSINNSWQATVDQINLLQPTILNITGHFLVGNGYYKQAEDLVITDPAYHYQRLSEHQSELLSTLIFTPSHTDLSYIQLVTDTDIDLTIKNSNDEVIKPITYLESISSFDETDEKHQKEINKKKIYQIPKPNSDNYRLSFINDNDSLNQFTLYSYDINGEVSIYQNNPVIKEDLAEYTFYYNKNNENQSKKIDITKIVSWQSIEQSIEYLYENNKIEQYIFTYSQKIIKWAKPETNNNQKRYLSLLKKYFSKAIVDSLIKEELIRDLQSLQDSI